MDPSTGATYGDEYGAGGGSGSGGAGTSGGGPPFTSNAAWSQYAQQFLAQTVGLDGGTVSAAVGGDIAGAAGTTAPKGLIDPAGGVAGPPPGPRPRRVPPQKTRHGI